MRTILIIILLLIVGYVVLQYSNTSTGRNTDTALKEAARETTEKAKEGYNELKEKVEKENIPEKIEKGAEKAENIALDASITAAVKMKLANDESVKARKIDVDTLNGHVTLNGEVSSTAEADRAIELAKQVDGIKSVTSRLQVKAS